MAKSQTPPSAGLPRHSQLKDVAELAEVSLAAASRVLNGDTTLRISDSKKQDVLDAATKLNYTATYAARALRTSKNSTIALMVPDVNSAIFAEVSRGAESAAAEHDLTVLLASSNQMSEDNDWVRRVVGQGRVDGLLLQPSDDVTEAAMGEVLKRRMPLVLMNSLPDGEFSTVRLDDEFGIEVALNHLFDLGHTRIGLLNGHPTSETAKRRLSGFHNGHIKRGLKANPAWITSFGYTGPDGRLAIDSLLGRPELPTALVVGNVNAALGAIAEIHKRGLRVPTDMSIVAFHDVWYADSIWPPLTTVRTPLFEMGRAAVEALMNTGSRTAPIHQVINNPPPTLLLRSSTTAAR